MAPGDHKRCGKCGYDLTGLPGVGECPECGGLFNTFTGEGVEASGSATSDAAHTMRWVKVWGGVGAVVFLFLCSGVVHLIAPQMQTFVYGCIVIAVVPALWALTNYMDDKN